MFLFPKTSSFVSTTDTEPHKLFSAGRSLSTCPSPDQAALGAHSFETDTKGNNAVVRLCFLEARTYTSETGKIYNPILTADWHICKMLGKGAVKTI